MEACPPSASYRLRKAARKYRTPLLVVGAFVLLLVAGVIVSTLQAIRATVAETKAESRKLEADDAREQAEKGRDELASLNQDLRRTNYVAQMVLAQQAWREAQMDEVREHLQKSEPRRPGDPDLRGFEWYYLRRLCDASTRTLRGHSGMVTCVAYSPDGRCVVSASMGDRTFKVWDVGSGQLIWTRPVRRKVSFA